MLEFLFPFGLAVFFLAIILPLIGPKLGISNIPRKASLLSTIVASIAILSFSLEIILSGKSYSLFAYQITPSFQFSFLVDRLAAFFLFLVCVVSVAVAIYSVQYVEHKAHEGRKNLIVCFMNIFILPWFWLLRRLACFRFSSSGKSWRYPHFCWS